ncbi:MAG: MFS transporter [Actinomycetota bacterium]
MAERARDVERRSWWSAGVGGIGAASLLSDAGHEIPTSLLPAFLTSTLGAPAAALGVIEGVADGVSGVARLAGGALADDPDRRRATAIGGYATTPVLSALIATASAVWQVGVLRVGAWAARGLRVPARNALLADLVPPAAYGRAYGFERAMDNLGAIVGPLLALALVGAVGIRGAIALSVIPGLLAVAAMAFAIRRIHATSSAERRPVRLRVRPVLRGRLGATMRIVTAFELGNVAVTLLILRAVELLSQTHTHDEAVRVSLWLYAGYNVAATIGSVGAGHAADRFGARRALVAGVAAFLVAYVTFGSAGPGVLVLAIAFGVAGLGKGFVETAEHAAVAADADEGIRGSAFGVLAGIQSFGNVAASSVAGLLWTAASPEWAFTWAASWMVLSLGVTAGLRLFNTSHT